VLSGSARSSELGPIEDSCQQVVILSGDTMNSVAYSCIGD
jgi:hypothetical protein